MGTAENPIFFEAVDSSATAGFWGAINLVGSPEAIFEYCVFRQADSAVHSWDSQVYIEQSLFEDNLVGIRFNASEISGASITQVGEPASFQAEYQKLATRLDAKSILFSMEVPNRLP